MHPREKEEVCVCVCVKGAWRVRSAPPLCEGSGSWMQGWRQRRLRRWRWRQRHLGRCEEGSRHARVSEGCPVVPET